MSATDAVPSLQTLRLALEGAVLHVVLNRPEKANAINAPMWQELRTAMDWLDRTDAARVGVLSAAGTRFCAGLDLAMFGQLQAGTEDACPGRSREHLRRHILDIQDTVSSIERCRKPVIAAVHGACVGGGVDIITACDMRYCSEEAWFSVKEIDVGLVADVGTLQRLPRIVGEGHARELAFTGRRVDAREAAQMRLVNRCYDTNDELRKRVAELAEGLVAKSPLSLRGTKEMINYARDHTVADSLNHVATWNAAMLFSLDLDEARAAAREGRPASYRD